MNTREAQSILQQEVQKRQAAEYLIQALELAALAEETVDKNKQQAAVTKQQLEDLKQEVVSYKKEVDAAKEKKDAEMRQIDAEYTARITKAHADTEKTIADLQAKVAAANEAYNERMQLFSEGEQQAKASFEKTRLILESKLKELYAQVEAEQIRLETTRRLVDELKRA